MTMAMIASTGFATRNEIVGTESGASITAFDIIIAGGDLGATRLIDYNAPHIL